MDMHCHLLWGVDDGAHTLRDSLEIISRLKEKGFRGAYCTPHISSRYPSNTPARLKARFQQLLDALPDRDFDLRLAAEYMLDHHFEQALEEEEPLSHDGSHLLVELPQFRLPSAWEGQAPTGPGERLRSRPGPSGTLREGSCLRRNWLPWPHRE